MATGYTKLHIVIDSHVKPKSSEEEQYIKECLSDLINELNTRQGYIDCFVPHLAKGTKLRGIQMLASSIERGTRYKRLHCHIVVLIRHSGQFLLQADDNVNITSRLATWVTERCPWLSDSSPYYKPDTRPYVRALLIPAYGENYVAKDGNDADTEDSV